jgi:hypothetical protein
VRILIKYGIIVITFRGADFEIPSWYALLTKMQVATPVLIKKNPLHNHNESNAARIDQDDRAAICSFEYDYEKVQFLGELRKIESGKSRPNQRLSFGGRR